MDKAQERMDAEYNSALKIASIGFAPTMPSGPTATPLGPMCAGLVEWPEDSDEEDPTSGTAAVAYRKGSCSVVRLDADGVHLGVDDAAWVPARVDPASAPGPFLIATNGFSQVRCVAGFWEARQGLALVLNVQDVEVDLSMGRYRGLRGLRGSLRRWSR